VVTCEFGEIVEWSLFSAETLWFDFIPQEYYMKSPWIETEAVWWEASVKETGLWTISIIKIYEYLNELFRYQHD
jgi:hypothetical protein